MGYRCWIVERWDSYARKRVDLFHCIDVLAIGNGETVGIQTTTRSNMWARRKKIQDNKYLPELLDSGWRIILEGWDKPKLVWRDKEEQIKLLDEHPGLPSAQGLTSPLSGAGGLF